MLPLYLSIEGFYSYQEKQEVDFTGLTEAGLFGIFGSVGSGKSSILEAISLALYGDTERLNKTDRRGYNMLNLKSGQAKIVFDLLNFEGKKYRFTAQWRRRPTKFDDTSTIERLAYVFENDRWVPLPSADGALVTNLSYPNFRRTIIIPQGQFKEFLELKGKERSDMMKEIFQLDRYDLGPKVSLLQSANQQKLENLRGALSGYDGISSAFLQEKEQQLLLEKDRLTQSKTTVDLEQTQLHILREAGERHQELAHKRTELDQLLAHKDKIDQIRKDLFTYEQTVSLFREPMDALQRMEKEKDTVGMRVEQLHTQRKGFSEEIDQLQEAFQKVEGVFQNIDRLRMEQADLQLLSYLRKNETLLQSEQANYKKGEPIIEQSRNELDSTQKALTDHEQQLERLKADRFETSELMEMDAWYLEQKNIKSQADAVQSEIDRLTREMEELQKSLTQGNYKVESWEEQLGADQTRIVAELQQIAEQETHLQVQVRLGDFAHSLVDGEPCPLCGAMEHPEPMSDEQAAQDLQAILQQKTALLNEQKQLHQRAQELHRFAHSLSEKGQQLATANQQHQSLQDNLSTHISTFRWEGYSPDDQTAFGEQKQKSKQNEAAIQQLENKIKELRALSLTQADIVGKYEKRIQKISEQIAIAQRLIQEYRQQLQVLSEADYQHHSEEDLVALKQHMDRHIAQTVEDHQQITRLLHQKQTSLADIAGRYQSAKDQFGQLREALVSSRAAISQLLAENGYSALAEVHQILNKELPLAALRQEVQDFDIQLQVVERQVENLIKRTAEDEYTPEKFSELQTRFAASKRAYETQMALYGGLEREIRHLTVEYAKKEKLVEEFEQRSKRAEQLKTMDNLFRGNGFVNYVSSIHMERLCEIANQRFHRLTKNQLSLCVSNTNDFEVIDNLHDGHRRSVKTLSGGQSFQASLCLALALAENIQSLNKADRNFFFIDEGFGTQDHDSMNTVFDTLQYLHQENRVVGIISHVEELKERMPRTVTVTKDFERGSLLKTNF